MSIKINERGFKRVTAEGRISRSYRQEFKSNKKQKPPQAV